MRRVTVNRLATMVAASTSLVANAGASIGAARADLTAMGGILRTAGAALRAPVMALTPVLFVGHDALADDETQELQEVTVTATAI